MPKGGKVVYLPEDHPGKLPKWKTPKQRQQERYKAREALRAEAARIMNQQARDMAKYPLAPEKHGPMQQWKIPNDLPRDISNFSPNSRPPSAPVNAGSLVPRGDQSLSGPRSILNGGPTPKTSNVGPIIEMVKNNGKWVPKPPGMALRTTGRAIARGLMRWFDLFQMFAHMHYLRTDTYWQTVTPPGGGWVRIWGPCAPRTPNVFGWVEAGTNLDTQQCIGNQALNTLTTDWNGKIRAVYWHTAPLGAPFRDAIHLFGRTLAEASDPATGPVAPSLGGTQTMAGAPAPFGEAYDPYRPRHPAPYFQPEMPLALRPYRNKLQQSDPETERLYELGMGQGGNPIPPVFPPHSVPFTPPPRRTKERKINVSLPRSLLMAWRVSMAVTEAKDLVDILFDALPEQVRDRAPRNAKTMTGAFIGVGVPYTDMTEKMRQLYRHWDKIDWNKAIPELIANQISDNVIGTISQKGGDVAKSKDIYGFGLATS